MQATRPLIVVLFLAAVAAAAMWLLGFADPAPAAPPAPLAPTVDRNGDAGNLERGDLAPAAGSPSQSDVRQAVADAGSGAVLAGGAAGLVGQVLDERQSPVAGAIVTCSPGLGGVDFENLETFDFEDGFDTEAMRERVRGAARERTETTTGADGRFRLAAGGQGRTLQLRVRAPSHVVLDKTVQRPVGKDADLGVLTLKIGAIVSGRVLDRSGAPVANANVRREDDAQPMPWGNFEIPDFAGVEDLTQMFGPGSVVTDAEGRFSLAHCAPGKFALRASHPDHPSSRREGLQVAPGQQLADVLVVVEPGAAIRGRILGVPEGMKPLRVMAGSKPAEGAGNQPAEAFAFLADAGEMIADAGMGFGEKQTVANADHTFELRGLQPGKVYRVWATQAGRGFVGSAACTERIETPAGTTGIELRYDPGVTVTFTVVAASSGAPVERMAVRDQLRGGGGVEDFMSFLPRSGRSKAYPDGKVTIANLRPKKKQTLQLSIEALGFAPHERKDITLPVEGALDLGVVKLDPAPVLQITVTAGPGRTPVAGASVRLSAPGREGRGRAAALAQFEGMMPGVAAGVGPGAGAKTDAEGRCSINALSGPMIVAVTSKDFAPYASAPIELPKGESGTHDVALVRGGTVEVRVADSMAAALPDQRVDHAAPGGERTNRRTDAEGVAVFAHLAPGEHRFRLGVQRVGADIAAFARVAGERGAADDAGWQRVLVEDGGKATLQIAKDPTASLRGIVRENGMPLAGARVAFVEGLASPAGQGGAEARVAGAVESALESFGAGGGGGGRSSRTGDTGAYELKELPAGEHRLRVTARGRVMPTEVQITLRQGENVFDIELDMTIVAGIVRDAAGQPVAGASVAAVLADAAGGTPGGNELRMVEDVMSGMDLPGLGGSRNTQKTGDDGRYELRGVAPGKPLQVRASAKGHAAALSAVVEVALGQRRDGVDVQLSAAGRIKVTMTESVPFATVVGTLLGADGQPDASVRPVVQMLRRGSATLDGLRPGRWQLRLGAAGGGNQEPRVVEVVAGETATLNW